MFMYVLVIVFIRPGPVVFTLKPKYSEQICSRHAKDENVNPGRYLYQFLWFLVHVQE